MRRSPKNLRQRISHLLNRQKQSMNKQIPKTLVQEILLGKQRPRHPTTIPLALSSSSKRSIQWATTMMAKLLMRVVRVALIQIQARRRQLPNQRKRKSPSLINPNQTRLISLTNRNPVLRSSSKRTTKSQLRLILRRPQSSTAIRSCLSIKSPLTRMALMIKTTKATVRRARTRMASAIPI